MNQIRDEGAQAIAQALARNQVRYTCSFFGFIANLLYLLQTLATLNLSRNEIRDAGAQAITQALQRNQVRCIFIFFTSISIVLYLLQTVAELNLEYNKIGDERVEVLRKLSTKKANLKISL